MTQQTKCPDRHTLELLLLGKLPENQTELLSEHLLHCEICGQIAETIDATDELTAAFAKTGTDYGEDEIVAQVISRGKQLHAHIETSEIDETIIGPDSPQPVGAPNTQSDRIGISLDNDIDFLAPAEQPDEIGRLGEYRVLEVLGVGGMGVIFQAEDPKLERLVALKVMKPTVAASRSEKERFLREAKSTASIEHDNIVRIYQVGEDRGVPFIAMEFLRGESLQHSLRRRGKLDQRDLLRIGKEIAAGLAAAHDRGLIHRDIKPDNIWIEADSGRAKILDFGLVRAMGDDASLTRTGVVVGTPKYMAPEQAQGLPVDNRCDLFSLGSVLYHLATGEAPFSGDNITATLIAVASEDPKAIDEINAEIHPALVRLIMRLLSKDPDQRPQSADEVVQAIADIELKLAAKHAPLASTTNLTQIVPQGVHKDSMPTRRANIGAGHEPPRFPRRRVGLFYGAATLFLLVGIIFFVQTKDGTIRVEINDPNIKVAIKGTGITLSQADQDKDITVAPGEKTLVVQRGDFKFETNKLVLKKGETVTVRVELLAGKIQVRQDEKLIGEKPLPRGGSLVTQTEPPGTASRWQPTPEQQRFFDAVVKVAPEQQVEAVREKLQEVNPGFDGKIEHEVENGRVVELRFLTDRVTGIWPVRALRDLERLDCSGSSNFKGGLADLSPLAGMALTVLHCSHTHVADLSPLTGMKLARLGCHYTHVSDLAPLKEMALTDLDCRGTQIADLSPLAGMPLTKLHCDSTRITDLSPLKGMPLTLLHCGATRVSDLSPLQGLPLTWLSIEGAQVADLSPLRGLLLTYLSCARTRVTQLTSIQGMPLEKLYCGGTRISDLSPLRGMPLKFLHCGTTQVSDLSPLKGMPLATLYFDFTQVSDLAPLQGMKLTRLACRRTRVSSLEPLKDMKLEYLWFDGSNVQDVAFLKNMPLLDVSCNEELARRNEPVLRKIKTLKTINGQPVEEFWQSAKQPVTSPASTAWQPSPEQQKFLDAVAKLEPEQRMKAVRGKLTKVNSGFDGTLEYKIEEGAVTQLAIHSPAVHDLWPVAALRGLRRLDCVETLVIDLAPLQGLPLLELKSSLTPYNERVLALVKSCPELKTVNGLSKEDWLARRQQVERLSETVGILPPESDLDRVIELLKAFNPGYDGKVTHKISGGEVVELTFGEFGEGNTAVIHDISPVRALTGLRGLSVSYTRIVDLSPLSGMKLTELGCPVRVADLSPLKGMPLRSLTCGGYVSDLSPLKEMKLTRLWCGGTADRDAPLKDLSPLKGMPLTSLRICYTRVADLSHLQGMPLTSLDCQGTQVTDLSALQGMRLTRLFCHDTQVVDLSPLKGMPLTSLSFHNTQVANLSPLKGMLLPSLNCELTLVEDLSPLKEMKLTGLNCANTPVADLSPLQGMPLRELYCYGSRVADLSPLKGMPLKFLVIDALLYCPENDAVLKSLPLDVLRVSDYGKMSSVAEYLKKLTERRKAAEEFATSVAELPVEKQIKAVRNRLQEFNPHSQSTFEAPAGNSPVTEASLVFTKYGANLTPLMALPQLKKLTITGGHISTDLSPLIFLALEELTCPDDMARKNAPVLRKIKTLKTINGRPAAAY